LIAVTTVFITPIFGFLVNLIVAHFSVAAIHIGIGVITSYVALLLYFLRCRKLLAYGIVECVVGTITATYFATLLAEKSPFALISGLSALYVSVRGADNIYKSIKDNGYRVRWNELFFGRSTSEKLG
jgi:hypothetical protein